MKGQAFICAAEGCECFFIHWNQLDPFGPLVRAGWRCEQSGKVYCPEHGIRLQVGNGDVFRLVASFTEKDDGCFASEVVSIDQIGNADQMEQEANEILGLARNIGVEFQQLFYMEYGSSDHADLYRRLEQMYARYLELIKAWQEAYGDESWNDYAA